MRLPAMPSSGSPNALRQNMFGGLDLSLAAGGGAIVGMTNLTGDHAPLLAPRARRGVLAPPSAPAETETDTNSDTETDTGTGMTATGAAYFSGSVLCAAGGSLYADGAEIYDSMVSDAAHTFCELSGRMVVLPEKLCVTKSEGSDGAVWTVTAIEASFAGAVTISGGTYAGESAEANTITAATAFPFSAGDAVTISGMSIDVNNGARIIREMSDDRKTMRFYENSFSLDAGSGMSETISEQNVTIKREMPDIEYICENENRLWGCKGNMVYASALGDPYNWNIFDGLSTDSYAVATGSGGDFTGCASYKGYPVFFKRDAIYKVYGSSPSKFQLLESCTLGVEPGSGRSTAIAGETLYYLSDAGFVAYSGGEPQLIGGIFGTNVLKNAIAGSDGVKYYVCCDVGDARSLYVMDTRSGEWFREDGSDPVCFFAIGGSLIMQLGDGSVIRVSGDKLPGETSEPPVEWSAVFGAQRLGDTGYKRVSAIELRVHLDTGSELTASISCDGGEFIPMSHAASAGIHTLRIVPRRCSEWQIKLSGKGDAALHTVTVRVRR